MRHYGSDKIQDVNINTAGSFKHFSAMFIGRFHYGKHYSHIVSTS